MFIHPTRTGQDVPSEQQEKVVSAPTTLFPSVQYISLTECCCRIKSLHSCSGTWLPLRSWNRPTNLSWKAQSRSWCCWWEDSHCPLVEHKVRPDESWAGFSHLMRSGCRQVAEMLGLYLNFSWKMQEDFRESMISFSTMLSRSKKFIFKTLCPNLQKLIN